MKATLPRCFNADGNPMARDYAQARFLLLTRVAVLVFVGACGASAQRAPTRSARTTAPTKRATCPGPVPAHATTGARQLLQTGDPEQIIAAAWSKGGHLATFSRTGAVRIWDVRGRGALVGTYQGNELASILVQLAWTEDEQLHVMGRANGPEEVVLDVSGNVLSRSTADALAPFVRTTNGFQVGRAKLTGHELTLSIEGTVRSLPRDAWYGEDVLLSSDGKRVALWGLRDAALWDLAKPGPAVHVEHCEDGVPSPNLDFVACYSRDAKAVRVRPVPTGEAFDLTLPDGFGWIHAWLSISSDGRLLAAAFPRGVALFDVSERRLLWTRDNLQLRPGARLAGRNAFATFTPDGGRVVAAFSGWLGVLDARSGRSIDNVAASIQLPRHLAWASPDRLVTSETGVVAIWRTDSGALERRLEAREAWLDRVAVLPSGDLLTTRDMDCKGADDRSVHRIWFDRWKGVVPPASLEDIDIDSDRGCRESAPPPHGEWPPAGESTMLSGDAVPAQLNLVTGGAIRETSVGDAISGRWVSTIGSTTSGAALSVEGHREEWTVAPGGWLVRATGPGSDAPVVEVVAARDGRPVLRVPGAWSFRISDDGKRIATFSGAPEIVVHDLALGVESKRIVAPKDEPVENVDMRGDSILVATRTWSNAGRYYRWGPAGLELLVEDSTGAPLAMALDPSGRRLAVIGTDGATRVFDLVARRLLASFVLFDDGEWISYTPGGAYRGTSEVASRVAWVFDRPTEAYGFERFAAGHDRHDLIERRLAGQDVDADAHVPRPPAARVAEAPRTSGATARIVVHVGSDARVDEVRALVEGREVASRSVCEKDADVTLDVPLLPGNNRVTAFAYDDRGVASNPAVADIESTAPGAGRPDLWLVSLGVNHYPNLPKQFQLGAAVNDARAIASAVQDAAKTRFGRVHSTLLVDDEVTVESALRAMNGLAEMKPNDLALVFFAGHGVRPSEAQGMVLLTSKSSASGESISANGIGWTVIADALAKARGRVVLLLDACHSGAISEELLVPNDDLASALAADGRAGVVVFAAAKGRQYSLEPNVARGFVLDTRRRALVGAQDAEPHGFFTGALLASLREPDTDLDRDGVVELSELVETVAIRVNEATGGRQSPWVARREVLGDFGLLAAPRRAP